MFAMIITNANNALQSRKIGKSSIYTDTHTARYPYYDITNRTLYRLLCNIRGDIRCRLFIG